MDRLPPPNQRKLNYLVAQTYGEQYEDWYQLARELQEVRGFTYTEISDHFASLGLSVSVATVYQWMQERCNESKAA